MNIKHQIFPGYSTTPKDIVSSVSEFITGAIGNDDTGYDSTVDQVEVNTRMAQEAIGRLVEVLVDRGILDLEEVAFIAHDSRVTTGLEFQR